MYADFLQRYKILNPNIVPDGDVADAKKISSKLMKSLTSIGVEQYKFGHTKMFFKAGIVGQMEDLRDERVAAILTAIQCEMRYQLAQRNYQHAIKRRDALEVLQNNIRAFSYLKEWEWMKIIFKIKPLISQAEDQKALQNLEKAYEEVKANLEKEVKRRKELEELEVVVRQVFQQFEHYAFLYNIF